MIFIAKRGSPTGPRPSRSFEERPDRGEQAKHNPAVVRRSDRGADRESSSWHVRFRTPDRARSRLHLLSWQRAPQGGPFLTCRHIFGDAASVDGETLVLLSGGIDSCATLALYRQRSMSVHALFVDYGQAAVVPECAAMERVAAHYGADVRVAKLSGLGRFGDGYIRGRNALLLQTALAAAPFETGQIAIGIHAGTSFPDCSTGFVSEMQRCFDVYGAGRIRVVAPFIDDDKRGVIDFCREAHVPMALTYSCERGTMPSCGECLSCRDRLAFDVQ